MSARPAALGRPPAGSMVSADKGVRAMVRAIEAERATAKVPAWPWVPAGVAMRYLPLRIVARIA